MFTIEPMGARRTAAVLAGAILGLGLLGASARPAQAAQDISGAGATFPYPIYAKWADAYKKLTGIGLNYQSIGSGGGIKQIKAKTVTFGASDMPLKPDDLKAVGSVAVSDDHRRRGAGGQHQGHRPRPAAPRRRRPSRRSIWATSPSGMIRASSS